MTSQTKQEMLAALEACDAKKAENLTILEMDKASGAFTDCFIICTGSNPRQIQAISDEIELQVKRQTGTYASQVEGYREGEWVLVDFVDFVVHIFSEEKRAFYGLERLWKSARHLTVAEIKALKPESASTEKKTAAKRVAKSAAVKPASIKAASTKAAKSSTAKSRTAKAPSTRAATKSASAKKRPAKKRA